MKDDFKGIKRIFNLTIAYFRLAVKDFLTKRKLRDKYRKYVPKYASRSVEQHQKIRQKIAVAPERCSHLKGGQRRGIFKDYNVSMHIFIGGNRRIICNSCRKKWTPESSDWAEALNMLKQSTNAASTSEVPLKCNMDGPIPEEVLNATFDKPVLYKGRYVYSRD